MILWLVPARFERRGDIPILVILGLLSVFYDPQITEIADKASREVGAETGGYRIGGALGFMAGEHVLGDHIGYVSRYVDLLRCDHFRGE